MRVLVTGANGLVGSALCRKLAARGDRVRGLVRYTSDLSSLVGVDVELVLGDLNDPASLMRATRDVEIVYHAAAAVSDWGTLAWFRRVNVDGTRHVLDAAIHQGVSRLVYVSSIAVHSFLGARDMDETSPQLPTTFPYSQSKREAEALALTYHRMGRIAVVIVRPGDVYGPEDRVVLLRIAPLLRRGLVPYIDGGRTLGPFTYVEHLAEGLALAGISEVAPGKAYIITDDTTMTWREYLERLTNALGWPRPWLSFPSWLVHPVASTLETLYRRLDLPCRPPVTRYMVEHLRNDIHFSSAKARAELGYAPSVGIDEAIACTAAWLREAWDRGERRSWQFCNE
jgi:nucleoside-diphosphate-sugar epimerase